MTEGTWQRNEIDSPCIKICLLHPQQKLCLGCYRSDKEIANWSRYSATERKKIMAELAGRAKLLVGKRKGGRARNTGKIKSCR